MTSRESFEVDVAILGGGIAGLGAAYKAREQGRQYVVFESEATAGGLLDNFTVDGYRFDKAVHLSFAEDSLIRDIFDRQEFYTHPAEGYSFEAGRWLKHPAQNNLYPLNAKEKLNLIKSFIERPDLDSISNYEDWLVNQYGFEISKRYPLTYTRKYWQCEARELSTSWIGSRVHRTTLDEVLFGAFTEETPSAYYAKEMRYPVKGGFKSFIQPLIDKSQIEYNSEVTAIDFSQKLIVINDSKEVHYKSLVNTLPLPFLVELIQEVPDSVRIAAAELEATSIDLISVGFNRPVTTSLWFYIYDDDIYASRAHSPSVKSSDNVPSGCSSLQFEIYSPRRPSQYDPEALKENVLYAIEKMGIASRDDVVFLHHKYLPWGNVVFKHNMELHRSVIRDFLQRNKVDTCGRFGAWDYYWSNQSFMSGYQVTL